MIGKATAIVAAAACAGVIASFAPDFAPEVAASAPTENARPTLAIEMWAPNAAAVQMAVKQHQKHGSRAAEDACRESWPYYETSCLRDARQPDGKARVVRVVSVEHPAPIKSKRGTR